MARSAQSRLATGMSYRASLRGESFAFADLRELLAKANEEKSGDQLAGLAAGSELNAWPRSSRWPTSRSARSPTRRSSRTTSPR